MPAQPELGQIVAAGGQRRAPFVERRRPVLAQNRTRPERVDVAGTFGAGIGEKALADEVGAAAGIGRPDDQRHRIGELAELRLAGAQRAFDPLALGNVLHRTADPLDLPVGVMDRPSGDAQVEDDAAPRREIDFDVEGNTFRDAGLERPPQAPAGLGRTALDRAVQRQFGIGCDFEQARQIVGPGNPAAGRIELPAAEARHLAAQAQQCLAVAARLFGLAPYRVVAKGDGAGETDQKEGENDNRFGAQQGVVTGRLIGPEPAFLDRDHVAHQIANGALGADALTGADKGLGGLRAALAARFDQCPDQRETAIDQGRELIEPHELRFVPGQHCTQGGKDFGLALLGHTDRREIGGIARQRIAPRRDFGIDRRQQRPAEKLQRFMALRDAGIGKVQLLHRAP